MPVRDNKPIYDLFVIGGGVNGCAITRDAAGRGLSVVLAEKNDLGSATSSASTKLFHGGLRYLEYFEFKLVREALIERETLLRAMPHISWPKRFVLPYHSDMRFESDTPTSKLLGVVMPWLRGRRPAWLIRLGLFLYDTMARRQILPATTTLDLTRDEAGLPLQDKYRKAVEYSDCWVEDSRLVVLNARDAQNRGAEILTHTEVISVERLDKLWLVRVKKHGHEQVFKARALINAGGPWVRKIIDDVLHIDSLESVRLVRGSHIVTKKLFDHDKCYFFQGHDGRIIFAIPYETDFTLIGTTEQEHKQDLKLVQCSLQEKKYLCEFASQFFARPVTEKDIVWTYSGVRPLYDDGASSATAATREYVLSLDDTDGAPVLNVFGGKITTHRALAEHALEKLSKYFPDHQQAWTAGVALPGGNFAVDGVAGLIDDLRSRFPFLDYAWAIRLVRAYGCEAQLMLGDAQNLNDLGVDFGATLYSVEVAWLMKYEFALSAEDVVWRRSKLGLRLDDAQIEKLDIWMNANTPQKQL